jgi:hypothetical protein
MPRNVTLSITLSNLSSSLKVLHSLVFKANVFLPKNKQLVFLQLSASLLEANHTDIELGRVV